MTVVDSEEFVGPRFFVFAAAVEIPTARTLEIALQNSSGARCRLLQYHQVLHQGLSGKHHDYGQCNYSAQGAGR